MIHDIQHIAISTPDMERALRFYTKLIGFELESDFELDADARADQILAVGAAARSRVVMLRLGETRLELFQFREPVGRPGDPDRPVCDHGITHLCLRVSDIESEYARLKGAGMHFHCPPQKLGPQSATYGRDPDGNVIELLERF